MDEKQVQQALSRVDQAVAQLASDRKTHTLLAKDIQLIRNCCAGYFVENKDGGTDKQPKRPRPGDKNN